MAVVGVPPLSDIERRLKVILHELEEHAADRPTGGEYITISLHKTEEAIDNVKRAQEKAEKAAA